MLVVMSSNFFDERALICIPYIVDQFKGFRKVRKQAHPDAGFPFIIGLNGVQGAGKTTLVKQLALELKENHNLETLVVSIDDFYMTHTDQQWLAKKCPGNALVQHRGEPGTHDTDLLRQFFYSMMNYQPTVVPQYDKSAFKGQGDRVPAEEWVAVNQEGTPRIEVIIFEGWCVGFRPRDPADIKQMHDESVFHADVSRLYRHRLEDLLFVNDQLAHYNWVTDRLSLFIHIDAQELKYVYKWRQEQEEALHLEKGTGMTEQQVKDFVDGYIPGYELYLDPLRKGFHVGKKGCHLRLVVGSDRKIIASEHL